MNKLGTAERAAHFHQQDLLNSAERDRLARTAATNSVRLHRPRLRISRLLVELGLRLTGARSTKRETVPHQSA